MNIFSVDFTINELQLLRSSLDVITIAGRDAKIVASLQTKLEQELESINQQLNEMELQKQQDLIKAIEADRKKSAKT